MFLLASITKPITYLGAMRLVEREQLNLTDPVTRYIPEFAAQGKEATLVLHLFTHTIGLPDMLPSNTELRREHAPLQKFLESAARDTVPCSCRERSSAIKAWARPWWPRLSSACKYTRMAHAIPTTDGARSSDKACRII
jgi:CubicO group peptidase (beta-lactamase class C family)